MPWTHYPLKCGATQVRKRSILGSRAEDDRHGFDLAVPNKFHRDFTSDARISVYPRPKAGFSIQHTGIDISNTDFHSLDMNVTPREHKKQKIQPHLS